MLGKNTKPKTLSDQLPYFAKDHSSDAIWLKDGSATLSLQIIPKDATFLTDEDLEQLRANLIPTLNHLPEGAVAQFLLIRERVSPTKSQTYQRWIQAHTSGGDLSSSERTELFNARQEQLTRLFESGTVFETRCYLTLRILPETHPKPGRSLGPFSHIAYWFDGKRKSTRNRQKIISDLNHSCEALELGLASAGFEVRSVPHRERVQLIYEWLNPERAKALPVSEGSDQSTLSEQVTLTDLIETQSGLSLGRTKLEVTSLKSLPEVTIPAALQELACAPHSFSMILTVFVLPQTQERERLLRKQRMAQGMASGNMVRNILAEAQLRDIENTLGALFSSGEKIFGVSFQIVGRKDQE